MKNVHYVMLAFVLLLASCTAEPQHLQICLQDESPGFLMGLWHGIISPAAFVASLFTEKVAVYAVCNGGGWYDFGFLLGASIIFGGSGAGSSRRRRRN